MSEPIVLEPEEIVAGIGDQKPQIRGIYSGDDAAVLCCRIRERPKLYTNI